MLSNTFLLLQSENGIVLWAKKRGATLYHIFLLCNLQDCKCNTFHLGNICCKVKKLYSSKIKTTSAIRKYRRCEDVTFCRLLYLIMSNVKVYWLPFHFEQFIIANIIMDLTSFILIKKILLRHLAPPLHIVPSHQWSNCNQRISAFSQFVWELKA